METHPLGTNPLSYEQVTVSNSAVGLTVPSGAVRAEFVVEDQPLRYRLDGTSPTATVGTLAKADKSFEIYGEAALEAFEAIRDGGTDANLSVHYYG